MRKCVAIAGALLLGLSARAQMQSQRSTFDIYAIDAEGGKATLYVSPSGESMLMDAGGNIPRIVAAAKDAGISQIDYMFVTHYDGDHVGGVKALSEAIPIKNFLDHGPRSNPPNTSPTQAQLDNWANTDAVYASAWAKGNHTVVKPGDVVPIKGITVNVVSSNMNVLTKPIGDGGKPNSLCASYKSHPPDTTENIFSAGVVISAFGGHFRVLDLGDLTWNIEHNLVCPNNLLGTVDLYMTTHH